MQYQQQQLQSKVMQYSLDTASAQVLSAWENAQRHAHQHRNTYNFPISPASSSSSPSSSISWPSSMSEHELRGLISGAAAATVPVTDPAANHHHQQQFFDFDFTLPHLHFQPQLAQSHNIHLRSSPPLPTPTTPSSSSSSSSALYATPPVSPISNMHFHDSDSPVSPPHALKRSSSSHSDYSSTGATTTGAGSTKKPRACMSMKDFVPPDVTGMSKREARLVKNRAAAFLSRQRKREEFELMEVRVAELEQENARLRDLADGLSPAPASSPLDSTSNHNNSAELEILRMQLSTSRQREAELNNQLALLQQQKEQSVKTETYEPVLGSEGTSSGANSPLMAASTLKNVVANPKGGASLGLMVLLCALPSLLSHPSSQSRSTLPSSRSFLDAIQWDAPAFFPASTSNTEDVPTWDLDYPNSGPSPGVHANMDMDVDFSHLHNNEDEGDGWKKLELGLDGTNDMGLKGLGLGALDISFATRRTKDGKIRVRVHSSPSPSPVASTFTVPPSSPPSHLPTNIDPALLPPSPNADKDGSNPLALSYVDADPLGPFFGAGSSPSPPSAPFDIAHSLSSTFASSAPWAAPASASEPTGETRRVRIALRSLPQPGGEGGEWEIEVR